MLHRCLQLFMVFTLVSGACLLSAQTQIDLRSQSRNIDFSNATSVRPFKTGTALPPKCNTGEMFFNTSAPAGSNMYGCAATNVWVQQAGGGGTPSLPAVLSDFSVDVDTGSNTLTLTCPSGQCNVLAGDSVTQYGNLQATFKPASGTYTAFLYLDAQGIRYGYPNGVSMATCSTVCVSGITQFPANVVPLYTVTVLAGSLQSSSLHNYQARFRIPKREIQGSNLILAETADSITWSTAPTVRLPITGTKPSCSGSTSGTFWYTAGATGQKDTVAVCAKDAGDNYGWRGIY